MYRQLCELCLLPAQHPSRSDRKCFAGDVERGSEGRRNPALRHTLTLLSGRCKPTSVRPARPLASGPPWRRSGSSVCCQSVHLMPRCVWCPSTHQAKNAYTFRANRRCLLGSVVRQNTSQAFTCSGFRVGSKSTRLAMRPARCVVRDTQKRRLA
jgi:hypothetical protein